VIRLPFSGFACGRIRRLITRMKSAVVICTRNRPDKLALTLEPISRFQPHDFELLVIDTSDETHREEVKRCVERFGGKYHYRNHRGLGASRNTALGMLTCDIVAFLDDDCVPEKDWLTRLTANFTESGIWAVTGRIISFDETLLFDRVACQDLGLEKRTFGPENIAFNPMEIFRNIAKVFSGQLRAGAPAPYGIGHGGNVAFRRDKLEQLGGFNESFWRASEDIEMFYRVLKAKGRIIYEPGALAVHWHPHITVEQVTRARHAYSQGTAAFMRANLNLRMSCLYLGRLAQLAVKYFQYRLNRQPALAAVYGADLKGWCRGLVSGNPRLPES
jgi:GT2 family glycosyltransferase